FVSSLLQEGTFTNISDKLTIYIGSRNERGEIMGVLINDDRDPQQPVALFAERGAFADAKDGSRIILVNGNRQRFDRATGKLSVLFALLFQSTDLGVKNLAASNYAAIPLIYFIDLLPLALGFGILLFGGIRLGVWRPATVR